MAKSQINRQDTLGSSSAETEPAPAPAPDASGALPLSLHEAAIHAPSHPLLADPTHRAPTEAIPAAAASPDLPGLTGSLDIHGNTHGFPFRDGEPEPEGLWYSGQGGITGDRVRQATIKA